MIKRIILALAAVLVTATAFAQNKTVSGKVSDERGDALPGATVVVSGTKAYAITDLDGKYSLTAKSGSEITVSYLTPCPLTASRNPLTRSLFGIEAGTPCIARIRL